MSIRLCNISERKRHFPTAVGTLTLSYSPPATSGMLALINLILGGILGFTRTWCPIQGCSFQWRTKKQQTKCCNSESKFLSRLSCDCHGRTPPTKEVSDHTSPSIKSMTDFYRTPWRNFHGLHWEVVYSSSAPNSTMVFKHSSLPGLWCSRVLTCQMEHSLSQFS